MPYPYETFLHSTSLGCGTIEAVYWKEDLIDPEPIAFFCPYCGEVWARCYPHGSSRRFWHVLAGPCDTCSVGSLWLGWMPDHNAALSREALEREFLIQYEEIDVWAPIPGGFQAGIQPELTEDF